MRNRRKLWLDTRGVPVITTTVNGERNAECWGWTPATAVPTKETKMTTREDFDDAPVGATATRPDGRKAVKTFETDGLPWNSDDGDWLSAYCVANEGFTLDDPTPPAPTTAREALDLAWELAHPVKEGQELPKGAQYIRQTETGFFTRAFSCADEASSRDEANIRTLDPLPEPEPDWLDAPAVMATCTGCDEEEPGFTVHICMYAGDWRCVECSHTTQWRNLTDVTPLYPREAGRLNPSNSSGLTQEQAPTWVKLRDPDRNILARGHVETKGQDA